MRTARIERKTSETQIRLALALDAPGTVTVSTGIGFFDHMVATLAVHGGLGLELDCIGDLHVDQHHTIEDCGLALGEAIRSALGDKKGIARAGHFRFPLDEALAGAVVDLSGRAYFLWEGTFANAFIGEMQSDMVSEFFKAVASALKATVHMKIEYGENDHHKCEALFKAFARALRAAVRIEEPGAESVPSTKGVL